MKVNMDNPIIPHSEQTLEKEERREYRSLNIILHSFLRSHKTRNKLKKKKVAITVCDMWNKKEKQYNKVIREITY